MRRALFVNDGLWRCLCPSFDAVALRQVAKPSTLTSKRRPQSKLQAPCAHRHYRYSTSANHATYGVSNSTGLGSPLTGANSLSHASVVQDDTNTAHSELLLPTPPSDEQLSSASIDSLKTALLALRGSKNYTLDDKVDRHARIIQVVNHLVGSRGQRLSAFEYECVMDAMADPSGSAKGICKIIDDMVARGIKPTATLCKSALDALMNHPDYYTRHDILHIMRQSWFPTDTPARQSIIVGMLREEQYELAFSRLMEMVSEGARIETWVYDIFILVFGKMAFVDEMVAILHARNKLDGNLPESLQCFVLEVCSEAYHREGVVAGWNSLVRTGTMQPSDGLLESVLAAASWHGDAELASEVLGLLSQRTKTRDYHYEAVADAFVRGGDAAGAMRILCIMETTGIQVQRAMLSEFSAALKSNPEQISAAETALWDFRKSGPLPRALVAAVLLCKAETEGSHAALQLLQSSEELCGMAASWRVMQDMIIHSRDEQTTRALCAMYGTHHTDADETRSQAVYGKLVLQCVSIGSMDLAFHFAQRFVDGSGGDVKNKNLAWVQPLVEAAVGAEDRRIWPVVDELLKFSHGAAARSIRAILQKSKVLKGAQGVATGSST